MRRVLVVANQTADGPSLREEVARKAARERTAFTLLIPASPPDAGLTWTESRARALATERMSRAVWSLCELGVDVDGVVGNARPLDAIADLLGARTFDEIIVSTLPRGVSRWLRSGLPRRVAARFGLPVTRVTAEIKGGIDHAA